MGIKKVNEVIKELQNEVLHPELIQDNKIHFSCDNEIYRVRMPNQLELLEADRRKNAKQIELINQDNTITLFNLKKVLKKKHGVDIEAMEKELLKLEEKTMLIYERMAKKPDEDLKGLEADKKACDEIMDERMVIIEEISIRTAPSIDVQSDNFYMHYLTYACTEKNREVENDILWEKPWVSFDEYLTSDDSNVKFFAMGHLTQLIMKARQ